jgi:uncharacterized protein
LTDIPRFTVEPGNWAILRLAPDDPVPAWTASAVFCSVTRTRDELSIVCPESAVPESVRREGGWAILKLDGPFPFTAAGILASIAVPLARAGIAIVAIGTWDTDYILVKRADLARALEALENAREDRERRRRVRVD